VCEDDDEQQHIPFVTGLAPELLDVDQAWGGTASQRLQIGYRGNPAEEQGEVKRTNLQRPQ
jgi:hypothetical protein